MRVIFALMFIVGIGIAGSAVYLAKEQFTSLQAENAELARRAANIVDSVPVLVAKKDLTYGLTLTKDDVQEVLFPKNAIPESAFLSLEDFFGEPGSEPRTVLRSMVKDEVVLQSKVTEFGKDAGIESKLEPGKRAFTIKVDSQTGVSGFLKPGAFVDIYWSGNVGSQSRTILLFPNVELIAVDQNFDEDTTKPTLAKTVTAQVTPEDVARLGQAQSSGRLSLSLRGATPEGFEVSENLNIEETQQSLLGIEAAVVEEAEEECYQTERRGTTVNRIRVACSGQDPSSLPVVNTPQLEAAPEQAEQQEGQPPVGGN